MTIEIRQLLIRSQVGPRASASAPAGSAYAAHELERMKAQLLAECKAWLREQLQATRER